MKYLLIVAFGVGALWDGLTTLLGLGHIIEAQSPLQYVLCLVGALLVLAFSLGTKFIFETSDLGGCFMKIVWVAAIIFDFYTSFTGNAEYIVLHEQMPDIQHLDQILSSPQLVVITALTIMVSGSPLALPYLLESS